MGMFGDLMAPADRAVDFAAGARLPGADDGQQDALRHSTWMAGTSRAISNALGGAVGKTIGPVAAQLLGLAYEGVTFPHSVYQRGLADAAQSATMDINNNAVGARVGAEAPDEEQMRQRLLQSARNASYEPNGYALGAGMLYRKR